MAVKVAQAHSSTCATVQRIAATSGGDVVRYDGRTFEEGRESVQQERGAMTRRATTLGAFALVSVLLLVSGGCGPAGSPLNGTQWKLVEWTLSSIDPADVTITAGFAGGRLSGRSGVNSYSGPYKLGPADAFSAGPLARTVMGGSELAMRAESAYLALMGQAKSYKLTDRKLILYNEGGNESLVFEATGK